MWVIFDKRIGDYCVMYDGPIREGSRGGRDQFSWENVKGDKDREFYLGHSVKALVGHWQKNKDPYWYARNKKSRQAGGAGIQLGVDLNFCG